MGRGGRDAEGPLHRKVGRPGPEAIVGDDAIAELLEILDHIARDSPRNARLVSERISAGIDRITRNPEARPIDPEAPPVPGGATARKVTVSGYTIRYVHPFVVHGDRCTLIVSIRRGRRKALDDPAYLMRWFEERAKRRE